METNNTQTNGANIMGNVAYTLTVNGNDIFDTYDFDLVDSILHAVVCLHSWRLVIRESGVETSLGGCGINAGHEWAECKTTYPMGRKSTMKVGG